MLNQRELATVLAALRHWQCRHTGPPPLDFTLHFETAEPLSAEEIDALCERLNSKSSQEDFLPIDHPEQSQ